MIPLTYALVTPARNEETFIEKTLTSMVSQTILPIKWVIVSDGSTDRTDDIVKNYLSTYDWIELVRMPEHRDRNFAAKVSCFNAGHERLSGLDYDIIGNLDADISFDGDYMEFLLKQFMQDERLGVAGTPFLEEHHSGYDYRFANIEHVSGACQLFRRQCYADIGGYIPIKGGGIDWVAVISARMRGWKTRTFTERTCFHHRPMGTGGSSWLEARFKLGKEDYYLGGHPLWEFLRAMLHLRYKPYILGGLFLYAGYLWAFLSRVKRPMPGELVEFHRREQMVRLKNIVRRAIGLA